MVIWVGTSGWSYDAAYCVMSGVGLPCVLQVTADFAYVRLHGNNDGGANAVRNARSLSALLRP